ncbi:MAG: hypothetical protein KAR13_03290, partial [Desulfobulbaceae bacterium]|nr:hypothetical protein [Desulfobulbaceae bacterium]
ATLSCKIIRVQPSSKARRPSQRKRIRLRTCLWDQYLQHADDKTISLFDTPVTGTPPPIGADREWQGRQIALLKSGRTLAMGEVRKVRKNVLHVSIADFSEAHDQILIRDAYRNTKGLLATAKLVGASTIHYIPPDIAPYPGPGGNTGPRPIVKFGEATAFLINGIFGDPLLHIRMHNQKRSILFDLGEGGRLPARLAHQVTDVFISHAHIDHISGFLWLMRSRIGRFPSCRLFGPPGLTGHIAGMMAGIHWDRIGEWGPIFEVGELHGQYLIVHKLQAGKECREQIDERPVPDGLLLKDSACEVQALTLDHGAIPVLSYCLKQTPKLNVRKDRLIARNLALGPWLGELKKQIVMGKRQTAIQLPDGHSGTVGNLADELILITPAQKMVYATDIDDNKGNREKLTMLAKGADIFFCEAAFIEADREKAKRSGHLTARGCGEIAQVAGAERLVPFHFSRRYERNPL